MLAVKDTTSSRLFDKHLNLEAVVVNVTHGTKDTIICLLYVPPNVGQLYHETLCLLFPVMNTF